MAPDAIEELEEEDRSPIETPAGLLPLTGLPRVTHVTGRRQMRHMGRISIARQMLPMGNI
jgi:hypothetical protein